MRSFTSLFSIVYILWNVSLVAAIEDKYDYCEDLVKLGDCRVDPEKVSTQCIDGINDVNDHCYKILNNYITGSLTFTDDERLSQIMYKVQ